MASYQAIITRRAARLARSLTAAVLLMLAPAVDITATSSQPLKILFIGDSFTGAQGGIYTHLTQLAQSKPGAAAPVTNQVVVGGAPLKRLWELGGAVRAIDSDKYDTVVLQDDIPEINADYFRQYSRMFIEEVRRHHARPILYMTWAYQRLGWISMTQIADAHRAVSRELGVDVAPVGVAWERAKHEQPGLDLFAADREHPSPSGMYLATCVLYATIYGENPTGLSYIPAELSPRDAPFLQRVAWETVMAWRKSQQ